MKKSSLRFFSVLLFITTLVIGGETAAHFPPLPHTDSEHASYTDFLKTRYTFDTKSLRWGEKYPVVVNGSNEEKFTPKIKCDENSKVISGLDTVVIGGGPSGLSSAFFLSKDPKRKVMLIEKEKNVGGLATGSPLMSGGRYGRGGAYFTSVEGKAKDIYKMIGMPDYEQKMAIHEPIDSYYWNGKYYEGLWENEKTMQELPADFNVFKYCLMKANDEGLIENQPISGKLDKLNFRTWVNTFPKMLKEKSDAGDEEAKKLLARFESDPKVDPAHPMDNVLKLLELYGRSALGDHPELISAAAFANFYISEVDKRYTSNIGAGIVSETIAKQLNTRSNYSQETNSPVTEVLTTKDGVSVCFVKDGKGVRVLAKYAVFAGPMSVAGKEMPQLAKLDPEKKKVIDEMQYRHYLVVNLHVAGHPWHKTYDLWTRNDKIYSQEEPTDYIDGRWMDFDGNEKLRTDNKGVITVYMPLSKEYVGKGLEEKEVVKMAERLAQKAQDTLNPLIVQDGGKPMQILAVEANRWPFSIHLATPGHFLEKSEILSRPVGNIFYAGMNLGTPAVEEALYRGWLAAEAIIAKSNFKSIRTTEELAIPARNH